MDFRYLARLVRRAAKGAGLGCTHIEFEQAISYEFRRADIAFKREVCIQVNGQALRLDMLVGDTGLELKVNGKGLESHHIIKQFSTYLSCPEIKEMILVVLDNDTGELNFKRKGRGEPIQTALKLRQARSLTPFSAISEDSVLTDPLTQADYEKIKGACKNHRDLLLCMTLRATGLRINELLRVRSEQLGKNGPSICILIRRSKKGAKVPWEHMFLPPQLGIQLCDYVKGSGIGPGQRIFKLSDRMVRYIFASAGLRAIGRPVHPHEFRVLYTKTLIDGGLPVEAAAKMLGHNDIRTTMKHYYDLTRVQREEIQRRIPV